jgi:hypothetical protein
MYISAAEMLRFRFSSPDRTALTSAWALSTAMTGSPMLAGTAAGSSWPVSSASNASATAGNDLRKSSLPGYQ